MAISSEVQTQIIEATKHGIDGAAVAGAAAAFMSWIPNVAAVLSVVWLGLRIYSIVLDLKDRRGKKDEVS